MIVEAAYEPYHIDELRQVRSYGLSFSEVISRSFQQQQPPLDPLANSAFQELVGQGDLRQRLLSVAFGTASIFLFGVLLRRRFGGVAALSGGLLLATAPTLIEVSAYARPYALPLLMMLTVVLCWDNWLQQSRRGFLWLGGGIALLLPLSRTTEPIIFLSVAFVVLVVFCRYELHPRPGATWSIALQAAIPALAVGLPVFLLVRSHGGDEFTEHGIIPSLTQLSRIGTELPEVLRSNIPAWAAVVAVAAIVLIDSDNRHRVARTWWFWVILGIPTGFAFAFFSQTPTSQPYYPRYTFSWFPVVGVLLAAVTRSIVLPKAGRSILYRTTAAFLVGGILTTFILESLSTLTTTKNPDWKQASAVIEEIAGVNTTVVFDHPRPPMAYRTFFAGRGRYLSGEAAVPSVNDVLREPKLVDSNANIFISLLGLQPEVPGWMRIPAGAGIALYIPGEPHIGRIGAADALEAFGRRLGHDSGSLMSLAAAKLYQFEGLAGQSESLVLDLLRDIDDPVTKRALTAIAEEHDLIFRRDRPRD
jgi:hypothetical protein